MAKQKIEDKQKAIIEAAIKVFAERGFWDTPTSLISKTAGVADGTLFTYFKTKDDLIQEVYLELKHELAGEIMGGLSAYDSVKEKMRYIWTQYIDWGLRHPDKFKVVHQIGSSYKLDEAVKAQGMALFIEIEQIANESIARGDFRDYPVEYLGAVFGSQADMTIQLISANPATSANYKAVGFEILWNGVTR